MTKRTRRTDSVGSTTVMALAATNRNKTLVKLANILRLQDRRVTSGSPSSRSGWRFFTSHFTTLSCAAASHHLIQQPGAEHH